MTLAQLMDEIPAATPDVSEALAAIHAGLGADSAYVATVDRRIIGRLLPELCTPDVIRQAFLRFLQTQILEATTAHWLRRADAFDRAGHPDTAETCRRHAAVLLSAGLESDVAALVAEAYGAVEEVGRHDDRRRAA